jgi:RHS repeat-associated protein
VSQISALERSEYRNLFLGERPLRILPGQYYDAETGKHYNYFRDYDPSIGRYVESDPIGLRGGISTFSYVGGRPITGIDRLGLDGNISDYLKPATRICVGALRLSAAGVSAVVLAAVGAATYSNPGDACSDDPSRKRQECKPKEDEPQCKFLREVKHGGPTKTCLYKGRGNIFTFPQYTDKPCPPIDPVTCIVDTTGLPNFK